MIKWVAKLWGAEKWLVNNDIYCAKELILVNGYQCSLHYHKIKDETFYILDGEVEIEMGYRDKSFPRRLLRKEIITLKRGDQIRIKPYDVHRFRSKDRSGLSRILEVSTTHRDEDSYRIEKSREIDIAG